MKYWPMIASVVIAISAASLAVSQRGAAKQIPLGDTRLRQDLPFEVVSEMLRIAQVGPTDHVIDLGSGDRRIVLTAVQQYGASGAGFINANLFDTDLSKATVLTMCLPPDVNLKLRPRLLKELRPGTRIVSHNVDMGDWKPDQQFTVGAGRTHQVYYWVVPAKIEGTWTIDGQFGEVAVQLTMSQAYQQFTGTARVGERAVPLRDTRLLGDRISFSLLSRGNKGQETALRFEGRVEGKDMHGTVTVDAASDQAVNWHATSAL
jgi:hypothetical protein